MSVIALDEFHRRLADRHHRRGRIQKISCSLNGNLSFELYDGERHILGVTWTPAGPLLTAGKPAHDGPASLQGALRKQLIGGELSSVTIDSVRRATIVDFAARERFRLLLGWSSQPRIAFCRYDPTSGLDTLHAQWGLRHAKPGTTAGTSSLCEPRAQVTEAWVEWLQNGTPLQALPASALPVPAVSRARKKLERLLSRLADDETRLGDPASLQAAGEALKAQLGSLPRGTSFLVWRDDDGAERQTALDPRLGDVENLEKLFHRAKRARRGKPLIARRREELQRALASVGKTSLAGSKPSTSHAGRRDDTLAPKMRVPYREFRSVGGTLLRVGRTARDNDVLTLKMANPDDLWFHVRGEVGAHVILERSGRDDEDARLDAAHLALWYSGRRHASGGEVQWTSRRYIRKRKGDPPGAIIPSREQVIFVRMDPERIKRLTGLSPSTES